MSLCNDSDMDYAVDVIYHDFAVTFHAVKPSAPQVPLAFLIQALARRLLEVAQELERKFPRDLQDLEQLARRILEFRS